MSELKSINKHNRDDLVREHDHYNINHIYEIKKGDTWVSHLDLGYQSVTKFISQFFSKFDADEVINLYYDKWQNDVNNKYYGKSKTEIKSDWDKFRDYKATKGTYMHLQFEKYFNGLQIDEIEEMPEFKKWVKDYKIKGYRTEMTVFSDDWNIVGNIDLIYEDEDGFYNICDFKRMEDVKQPFNHHVLDVPLENYIDSEETKHSMQLSIYKDILEKEYGMKIKGIYNLYIIGYNLYNYKKRDYIDLQKLGVLK